MSERDWGSMPIHILRQEYLKECTALHTTLLEGALWEEVRDQRITVTRIAQAIHRKTGITNPAESLLRIERGQGSPIDYVL